MNTTCINCDQPAGTYHDQSGQGALCHKCAELDILVWSGEMEEDEHRELLQRIVTAIKEDPEAFHVARTALIIAGLVKYEDLL